MAPLHQKLGRIGRKTFVLIVSLIYTLNLFLGVYTVSALSLEQKKVLQSGSLYFNTTVEDYNKCSTTPSTSSLKPASEIYILGDSITNGSSQKYRDTFTTSGFSPYINAVGGRSWIYPGSSSAGAFTPEAGGAQTGKAAIEADSSHIANAGAIVVALGSNGGLSSNPISEIITTIRTKNSTAPIWWVNIVASDNNTYANVASFGDFNTALDKQVPTITVIDWHAKVIPDGNFSDVPTQTKQDPNGYISSDGLHPTDTGQVALVNLVTSAVISSNVTLPPEVGCSCTVSDPAATMGTPDENHKNAWNYFTSTKGLSKEATAGLMGNLEAESGINPHNTQDSAKDSAGNPVPDGPEIPFDLIKDKYGYGIAQWTSINRQQGLIDLASTEPKRSTGDLGLQLDYLWQELTLKYAGVLTKLQEPGITVQAASDEAVLHFIVPLSVLPKSGEASKQKELENRRSKSITIFNTYSDLPPGTYMSATCVSSGGEGVIINLVSADTSSVVCAEGTVDKGIADGYSDGKLSRIRLCGVAGITVNSQISGPLKSLLADASASGISLSGGSFRSMDGQIDIYNSWCKQSGISPTPPPYPKPSIKDYVRCPGGGAPGYSNHQMGAAIDFNCSGTLIPQQYSAAKDNVCFVWLNANAKKYGLYEWGKGLKRASSGYEAWHWSVDGS